MSEANRAAAVAVGRIVGAFGVRGEVKVVASDPQDVRPGLTITARLPDSTERRLTILGIRQHQDRLLVRFDGIADGDQAGGLRGALLLALVADLLPLPPNVYRDDDLVGMRVTDARLGPLGEVSGVLHYPHADMLVVGERSLLVPMLAAYEVKIDRAAATIWTKLPDGFEDL